MSAELSRLLLGAHTANEREAFRARREGGTRLAVPVFTQKQKKNASRCGQGDISRREEIALHTFQRRGYGRTQHCAAPMAFNFLRRRKKRQGGLEGPWGAVDLNYSSQGEGSARLSHTYLRLVVHSQFLCRVGGSIQLPCEVHNCLYVNWKRYDGSIIFSPRIARPCRVLWSIVHHQGLGVIAGEKAIIGDSDRGRAIFEKQDGRDGFNSIGMCVNRVVSGSSDVST